MARFLDLSLPIHHHAGRLGLKVAFETPFTFAKDGWQGSAVRMFCHHGTHVDAPNHFIEGAAGIDQAPLAKLIGPGAVIDLKDHGRSRGIEAATLAARGTHLRAGDIAILCTGWTDRHWGTDAMWQESPFLTPEGADWLIASGVKAIVYDFSEEFIVRQAGFDGRQCIVHHMILGAGIYNIEYVHNLPKLREPRVTLMAMPLKLVGLDGSPARVVAIEGAELFASFAVEGEASDPKTAR